MFLGNSCRLCLSFSLIPSLLCSLSLSRYLFSTQIYLSLTLPLSQSRIVFLLLPLSLSPPPLLTYWHTSWHLLLHTTHAITAACLPLSLDYAHTVNHHQVINWIWHHGACRIGKFGTAHRIASKWGNLKEIYLNTTKTCTAITWELTTS